MYHAYHKTDIEDETTSDSALCVTAQNKDYDGDALYQLHLKLQSDVKACEPLHPKYTMLNEDGMRLSNCVALPDQHLCILNAWMHDR